MIDLKPCPFCGGEAYIYAPGPAEHHVACKNPNCYAETYGWMTEAEAIAAWNARAERTCRIVGEWEPFTQTQDLRFPSCSECGYNFGREERLGDFIRERCEIPNFCPNCGAKVVDAECGAYVYGSLFELRVNEVMGK